MENRPTDGSAVGRQDDHPPVDSSSDVVDLSSLASPTGNTAPQPDVVPGDPAGDVLWEEGSAGSDDLAGWAWEPPTSWDLTSLEERPPSEAEPIAAEGAPDAEPLEQPAVPAEAAAREEPDMDREEEDVFDLPEDPAVVSDTSAWANNGTDDIPDPEGEPLDSGDDGDEDEHAPLLQDEHLADRQVLRDLLAEITLAINGQDWEAIFPHLGDRVVVTLMDQQPMVGQEEVRAYLDRMFRGASSLLADVHCDPIIRCPAEFYGNVAVFSLTSTDRFTFRNAKLIEVRSAWSGTLEKTEAGWKLVCLHGGASPFDNPMSESLQTAVKVGIGAVGAAAGVLGFLLGRRR